MSLVRYTLKDNFTNKDLENLMIKLNQKYIANFRENPDDIFDPELLWEWMRNGTPCNIKNNTYTQEWKYVGDDSKNGIVIFNKFMKDLSCSDNFNEIVSHIEWKL